MRKRLRGSWGIVAPTPIGDGWGWGLRTLEVAVLPAALVIKALAYSYLTLEWVLERVLP